MEEQMLSLEEYYTFDELVKSGELPSVNEIIDDYHQKRDAIDNIIKEMDSIKDSSEINKYLKEALNLSNEFIKMIKIYTNYFIMNKNIKILEERNDIMKKSSGKLCNRHL